MKHRLRDRIIGQTLAPRDQYESTGVGLAVVKKHVETAGGRIWVTSEVGKGSTFHFTVPKQIRPSAPQTPSTLEQKEIAALGGS